MRTGLEFPCGCVWKRARWGGKLLRVANYRAYPRGGSDSGMSSSLRYIEATRPIVDRYNGVSQHAVRVPLSDGDCVGTYAIEHRRALIRLYR